MKNKSLQVESKTMSNLLHSLSLSLLLLTFFFVFFIISMAAQNDSSHPSCFTHYCANITIRYPFWRITSEPTIQNCGYEGFGIKCSRNRDQQIPILNLGDDSSYYVRNISYESKTIILVDVSPVVPCPRVRHGIDLATLPFEFWRENVNLSFHFDCSNMSIIPDFANEIPCLSNRTSKSCVHSMNLQPENFNWDEYSCDENVVTTVLDVFRSQRAVATDFIGALRRGFELRWGRMEDCDKCEESGGLCGHRNNVDEFLCFCSGGTTTKGDCKGTAGSSNKWRRKLDVYTQLKVRLVGAKLGLYRCFSGAILSSIHELGLIIDQF